MRVQHIKFSPAKGLENAPLTLFSVRLSLIVGLGITVSPPPYTPQVVEEVKKHFKCRGLHQMLSG